LPPAARITDMHTCPMVTVLVPHVGGPILPPCAPTVMIGFLPAARVTDPAVCVGPPDSIARGAQSVLIGGLPAARLLDLTIHGGLIAIGCPTVIIGDPAVTFPFSVVGTTAQITQIQQALAALYSTPSGKALIASIAASGHTVTIQTTTGGSQCSGATPGVKTDSTVSWNPSQNLPGLPAGDPRSGAVVLGHELCHADHGANGTNANGPNDHDPAQAGTSTSQRGEERQTVGSKPPYDAAGNPVTDAAGNPAGTHVRQPNGTFAPGPDYTSGPPAGQTTENSIRNDFGFPQRGTYYGSAWPGGPPW
jgi:uncharacterized Zn-binding protein involved in type VI secretion